MKRSKLGDIYELKTPKGRVYLQYVYKDKMLGYLIRVLTGVYKTRPDNFSGIVEKEEFFIFFPLVTAINQKTVEFVNFSELKTIKKPQYMRARHQIKEKLIGWHIVNTDTWERKLVKNLTAEQRKMSPWEIWNDTTLLHHLSEGWTLDKW